MTRRDSSRSARDLVERRVVAVADKAAVALERGQFVGERRRPACRRARRLAGAAPLLLRRFPLAVCSCFRSRCASASAANEAVADRGKIARPAAADREARQRRARCPAQPPAARARRCAAVYRREAPRWRRAVRCNRIGIGRAARRAAAPAGGSRRRSLCGRWRQARSRAARRRACASVRDWRGSRRRSPWPRPAPRAAAATAADACRAACARHR